MFGGRLVADGHAVVTFLCRVESVDGLITVAGVYLRGRLDFALSPRLVNRT